MREAQVAKSPARRAGKRKEPAPALPARPDFRYERSCWEQGYRVVVGVDEAGRGALAGPVAVGALALPPTISPDSLNGVRDSKQMAATDRSLWALRLHRLALGWGVGWATPAEIDQLGIVPATYLAARRAIEQLPVQPDCLLTDYFTLPQVPFQQTPIVKGDAISLTVAGASILAKTWRDGYLEELDGQYPGYGFARHKGYGTARHLEALQRLGPSPVHRRSFAPLRLVELTSA